MSLLARSTSLALLLVACSRREPPAPAPVETCPGTVRGQAVTGLEEHDVRFRLFVEGEPVYPICDTCGVTMVVDPPGPTMAVHAHQVHDTGLILGDLVAEPPDGACVRVSGRLGDFEGHPAGRYRRATSR